eukprot:Awhi_evm2s3980
MGRAVEWGIWANYMAITAALNGVCGAYCIFFIPYPNKWVGIYAMVMSHIVLLLEYPRSKRARGSNFPRWMQMPIQKVVSMIPFWSNYLVRSMFYMAIAVPFFVEIPTAYASAFFMTASIIYAMGHFKGEMWEPIPVRGAPRPAKIVAPVDTSTTNLIKN